MGDKFSLNGGSEGQHEGARSLERRRKIGMDVVGKTRWQGQVNGVDLIERKLRAPVGVEHTQRDESIEPLILLEIADGARRDLDRRGVAKRGDSKVRQRFTHHHRDHEREKDPTGDELQTVAHRRQSNERKDDHCDDDDFEGALDVTAEGRNEQDPAEGRHENAHDGPLGYGALGRVLDDVAESEHGEDDDRELSRGPDVTSEGDRTHFGNQVPEVADLEKIEYSRDGERYPTG